MVQLDKGLVMRLERHNTRTMHWHEYWYALGYSGSCSTSSRIWYGTHRVLGCNCKKGWNMLFQEAEGTREFSKSLQGLTASMPSHNE
jgi:hypothetical protein